MKKQYFLFFFLLFSYLCLSQKLPAQNPEKEIDKRIESLDKTDASDNNISKYENLAEASKKISYKKGVLESKINLINLYRMRSKYQKALTLANEAEIIAKDLKDYDFLSISYIYKARVYSDLGFDDENLKNIKTAIQFAKKINDKDIMHYKLAMIYAALSSYYEPKKSDSVLFYLQSELRETEQISDNNKELRIKKHSGIIFNSINLGSFYTGLAKPRRLDLAEPFFRKALGYQYKEPEIFKIYNLDVLTASGRFYYEKGDYKQAIELSMQALTLEKRKKDPQSRYIAFMNLSNSYEQLKKSDSTAKYSILFSRLNDSMRYTQMRGANDHIKQAVSVKEKEKDIENISNIKSLVAIIATILLIIGLIIWILWKRDQKILHKKYESVISQLKSEENRYVEETANNSADKNIHIHDNTIKYNFTKTRQIRKI